MRYDCLIIDDEKELCNNTAEYFNMFDVKTAAVYSSAEAVAFLDSNQTDLFAEFKAAAIRKIDVEQDKIRLI